MSPEERRRIQKELEDAFAHLNCDNREKLVRFAQHLAQHKLISQGYLGEDNTEPCCLCNYLN